MGKASEGAALDGLLQQRPLLRPGEVLETMRGPVVTQHSGDGKASRHDPRHATEMSVVSGPSQ